MKKLTLAVIVSAAMSTSAFANDHMEKIDSTFADLDSDKNGMISMSEAQNSSVKGYFDALDTNSDDSVSQNEFITYMESQPSKFSEDVKENVRYTEVQVEKDMDNVAAQSESTIAQTEKQMDQSMDSASSQAQSNMQNMDNEMHAVKAHGQDKMDGYKTQQSDRDGDIAMSSDQAAQPKGEVVARNEFKMLDANGDGEVTKDEASKVGINSTFDDIDANSDEVLTRKEYKMYRDSEEAEE